MWQQEGLAISSRRRKSLKGRRSDQPDHLTELVDLVQHLRGWIAELETENAQLRESARSFADLAERLNKKVREAVERA